MQGKDRTMRIGIDARFAVRNRRGIGNYTLQLIKNLVEIDCHNKYILYIDKSDEENVLPIKKNVIIKKLSPENYFLWEQVILPKYAQRDKIDILHCTGNTAPLFLTGQVKLLMSIMDVMYLKDSSIVPKSSSLYQKFGRLYRKLIVPKALRGANRSITISSYSKQDMLVHLPFFPEDKVTVIYLASDERFTVVSKVIAKRKLKSDYNISGSYLLALGAIDPRKNTRLIISTFLELKEKELIKEKLVVTGIANWKQTELYDMVVESPFKNDIVFTSFISEEDLVYLYNCAAVFLYPSLYEGFGLPLLEAMSCGVPVITSNTTSIPEIAGDAAVLVDPTNREQLKQAITKVLNDEILRDDMIKKGFEQSAKFSWRKTAIDTLATYEALMQERGSTQ